jgi:hypothetical protein
MTRVIISEDCGNSPKNISLEKLTIAFAKGDSKFILGNVTDDIRLNIVGDTSVQGKDNLAGRLERLINDKAVELTIDHVSTHGKAGAVSGTTKLKKGRTCAFCDVDKFSGARGTSVRETTSYGIEIKGNPHSLPQDNIK